MDTGDYVDSFQRLSYCESIRRRAEEAVCENRLTPEQHDEIIENLGCRPIDDVNEYNNIRDNANPAGDALNIQILRLIGAWR